MAEPYEPADDQGHDPLMSVDNNYQNLGGLPYANLNPNEPPPADPKAPPPLHHSKQPLSDKPQQSKSKPIGKDGGEDEQESEHSESKEKASDNARVVKLRKKIGCARVLYWLMIFIWTVFLIFFVLIHLNTFGIHLLPFLKK